LKKWRDLLPSPRANIKELHHQESKLQRHFGSVVYYSGETEGYGEEVKKCRCFDGVLRGKELKLEDLGTSHIGGWGKGRT
jgi:hypothetical protein